MSLEALAGMICFLVCGMVIAAITGNSAFPSSRRLVVGMVGTLLAAIGYTVSLYLLVR